MFAVVYKKSVIVGPMDWNRAIFEGSLERKGVEITLPRRAPDELPMVINEDCKICAVQENRPEINILTHYYYGPLWDTTGDVAIATYEAYESPLDAVKSNYKLVAANERWKKEVKGIKLSIQGKEVSVSTEREKRDVFAQKHNSMASDDTLTWKFDEAWIVLTKSDVASIAAAINNHVQDCFNWEKDICDQIDSKTTAADIVAIEIIEVPKEPESLLGRGRLE